MAVGQRDFFSYLYAVLHAPGYRLRYGPGLASAFPRVPLTRDGVLFRALADAGEQLLALHLGEPATATLPRPRLVAGADRRVDRAVVALQRPKSDGEGGLRVAINDASYFEGVPQAAWEFRVGGHQVCHKWLLDRARAGRELDVAEATRYGEVVCAVTMTLRIMSDIDRCIDAAGGFPGAFAC
jgi:predicted helicase